MERISVQEIAEYHKAQAAELRRHLQELTVSGFGNGETEADYPFTLIQWHEKAAGVLDGLCKSIFD